MTTLQNGAIQIKAMSRAELCAMYGVSRRTLNAWVKRFTDLGDMKGQKVLAPCQVKKIFEHVGEPAEKENLSTNKHN